MGEQNDKKPLKSETLKAGSINYFFDLLLSQKGNKYLKITQSKFTKETNTHERTQILVFERNFDDFKSTVNKVLEG
ncbi:DUF3276 family protein [Candidatus Gottesmanbacteria bacterium]|nr:DUF3276 family protein [Candidatus Gottesmanbacteria bacterium]